MLQDPKEIVKIWTDEITKASTTIVQARMKGEDVEHTDVDVTIQIPNPLLQAVVIASEKTGVDPDEILSEMASQGFKASIDAKLSMGRTNEVQQPKNPMDILNQFKGLGLDVSGLEGKMGDLNNLMSMFAEMKEQIDGATKQYGDMQSEGEDSEDTE